MLGARLHRVVSLFDEENPASTLASVEGGYERRFGSAVLAFEVGKAVWCGCGRTNPGVSGEMRVGYVF